MPIADPSTTSRHFGAETKIYIIITILNLIGVVYYTLGNIDPKLRSSLKCIQLLSIAKYEYIRTHGVEELLKPIINDVLKLEQVRIHRAFGILMNCPCTQESGIDFDVNGEIYRLRGTITVFSADYLDAWAVGGFKALMSAFRKCQFCMVTDAEMQTLVYHLE